MILVKELQVVEILNSFVKNAKIKKKYFFKAVTINLTKKNSTINIQPVILGFNILIR